MWIATDDRRILLYVAADPENGSEVGRIMLPAAPLCQVPPPSSLLSQDVHHQVKMFATQLTMLVLNPPIASATFAGAPLWQGLRRFGERPSTNLQEGPHCQLGPQQPCHPHNRNRSCVLPLTNLWSALHGLWTEDLDGRRLGQRRHQELHGQWGTSRGRDAQPQRA